MTYLTSNGTRSVVHSSLHSTCMHVGRRDRTVSSRGGGGGGGGGGGTTPVCLPDEFTGGGTRLACSLDQFTTPVAESAATLEGEMTLESK